MKHTVVEQFMAMSDRYPDRVAVVFKENGKWISLTYKQLKYQAIDYARQVDKKSSIIPLLHNFITSV